MDLYHGTFIVFIPVISLVFLISLRRQAQHLPDDPSSEPPESRYLGDTEKERLKSLRLRFFPVYLLVTAADWLQGPYIYPLYREEKELPEKTVALLFLTGFVFAGISASFAGSFADRFGRRTACLTYCIVYSFSCLTLLFDEVIVLFVGRALGGISATLLWTVFESWLVAEYNGLLLRDDQARLSRIFGFMTTSNTCVAILAGVTAEWSVGWAGTAKTPFLASVLCLVLAGLAITALWGENYGDRKTKTSESERLLDRASETIQGSRSTLKTILQDPKILAISLASCFFEGSLYIFVFFKFPALIFSHGLAGHIDELPFGLIFATLMCSMMLGSMIYNIFSRHSKPEVLSKQILPRTLFVASLTFLTPVCTRNESMTFLCFCVFEICCGIYQPTIATLKGMYVDDSSRASIYGLLRIPLNIFVVLCLSTTKEGERHRDVIFSTCSTLLFISAIAVHRWLR